MKSTYNGNYGLTGKTCFKNNGFNQLTKVRDQQICQADLPWTTDPSTNRFVFVDGLVKNNILSTDVNRNNKCSDFGKKNYSGNGNSLCSNFGNNSAVTVVLN